MIDDYYNSEQFILDFRRWLVESGALESIQASERAIREKIASENN